MVKSKTSQLLFKIGQKNLIILGLVLISLGNAFQYTFLNIDLDAMLANIGALLLSVGLLQLIIDEDSKVELIRDVIRATSGNTRLEESGIIDCCINSKQVKEEEEWLEAQHIVIGVHYSNRFIEDNIPLIKARIRQNKVTTILHLNPDSKAAEYLQVGKCGYSDPKQAISQMKELIEDQFPSTDKIKLKSHDRVLRYSFIATEKSIWIKFFTNSEGYAIVPALKIRSDSQICEFVKQDLERMGVTL